MGASFKLNVFVTFLRPVFQSSSFLAKKIDPRNQALQHFDLDALIWNKASIILHLFIAFDMNFYSTNYTEMSGHSLALSLSRLRYLSFSSSNNRVFSLSLTS